METCDIFRLSAIQNDLIGFLYYICKLLTNIYQYQIYINMGVTLRSLLLVVAFTLCVQTFAQDNHESQSPLIGLWVLKGVRIEGSLMPHGSQSTFKLIASDKTFINFTVMPQNSLITAKGTIDFVSDSIFVENIDKSMNSSFNGKSNELQYQLEEENLLYVKFFVEKSSTGQNLNQWYEEVWMRVEMPVQKGNGAKTII